MNETLKPRIDSIRVWTSSPRRQPKAGDLRETKKHGKQVRIHQTSNGMRCISGSRYLFDWVSYDEARDRGLGHLLPKEAAQSEPA